MGYEKFLSEKAFLDLPTGKEPGAINPKLYEFQADIVRWAVRRGRSAIFADCGLGKTPMQLEWARQVIGDCGYGLILAPLAVSSQTVQEGVKFDVDVKAVRDESELEGPGIYITNYEMLSHFDNVEFDAVVTDESGILKNYAGKYRNQIIDRFKDTQFKLACTATPAPNDHMELGNHAEFLGAMSRTEMLSMFFVHDGGEVQKWRLKGHAQTDFWKWLCSWAVNIRKPSDIGYDDGGFTLPGIQHHPITIQTESTCDFLFPMEAQTLAERLVARRETTQERAQAAAEIIKTKPNEPWLVWCNLNKEADTLQKLLPGAVQVAGSDKPEVKEKRLIGFSRGEFDIMITKPKIAGFGMNWQHCSNVLFLGLSDSWEAYYQAVRRCWRFGQDKIVDVYIVTADVEGAVVKNIERKERDAIIMAESMVEHMSEITKKEIGGMSKDTSTYKTAEQESENYTIHLGDCVEVVKDIETGSIDYSIFSPPFASLYTYSNSDRDMGNCKDHAEFDEHFSYLVPELLRITKPGRLLSFHCMNIPTTKTRDGYIGIRDFRGGLIKRFQDAGFIYHSEVCIWKDPVVAMQRTKALGLLHKQMLKDSCMSRQGIPDYLITMRKPGDNPDPVDGPFEYFCGDERTFKNDGKLSIDVWQRYASPVWMDIRPGNTLQKASARENEDERHICPLQLDVIERALQLWTNEGDTVFSPFAGIGSEGFVSLKLGRKFIGAELKESYYNQAVLNLEAADNTYFQGDLFNAAK